MSARVEPKVSVLITTYNHERYIGEALESVLGQETTFQFEVVVADDASTDGTRNTLEGFAARYPDRLHVSHREKNRGDKGLENFLLGLEACRGEYIATLDGDDYWTDFRKLQRQADYLDARPSCSMCFHNCTIEYEDGGHKSWDTTRPLQKESITTEDLLKDAIGQMSTIMMRREVANELRGRSQLLGDWLLSDWFIGLIASRLGSIGYIDRVMSVFRQHAGSGFSSLSRAQQWAEFVYGYERMEALFGEDYHDLFEQAICVRSYLAATEYEKKHDFRNAREFLARALKGQAAWLEPYSAGYGLTSDELFQALHRRQRLYRFPVLARLWPSLERLAREARWHWLAVSLKMRSHLRLSRHRPVGLMKASPNPVRALSSPGHAGVGLAWSASTELVEVRVGRPDGPLLSRTIASGKTLTGEWVTDGTIFYLQNVLGDLPLTLENTLSVVRVRVKG